jgi:ubiquinone/menaquinone biosynthesis C-methylase UbiE
VDIAVFETGQYRNGFEIMLADVIQSYIPPNVTVRDEWLKDRLSKLSTGTRLIDVGAGECRNRIFCPHLNYTSQDFNQFQGGQNAWDSKRTNWDTSKIDIVSDITSIPVENASFDAVLCTEVFEHLPSPIDALKEFKRILKPKGTLIITAPFNSLVHQSPYYFYSGFSSFFYREHLTQLGFAVEEVTSNGNFYRYLDQELRRLPLLMEQYSKLRMSTFYNIILILLLRFLKKLGDGDSKTSEVLNFGHHVIAKNGSI